MKSKCTALILAAIVIAGCIGGEPEPRPPEAKKSASTAAAGPKAAANTPTKETPKDANPTSSPAPAAPTATRTTPSEPKAAAPLPTAVQAPSEDDPWATPADLAGIQTRWVLVKIFAVMGGLCAVAAAISTARLNAATNALGTLDELYVIAAAVIGGSSLADGVGTIVGAMLGAVVMQSLQSGMVLMGLDTPLQNIVVGLVLVVAVWLDTLYRSQAK